MGAYDFVTADKFGKDSWPYFGPLSYNLALFWPFSGLDMALWQNVALASWQP